ncbi:IclR family transcriptional regulator [Streptomyces viridochromogenes]|uniref:IclR family transcriptional regulator n=1 Tax=Streptomyces viridochromogenes TaxID=1938 RepID=A0A0J7Z4N2_STRVR|nr:IclR family transcriptional regulator [Streptomyces viridochromogenes]KMS71091.1 IclR family transcriptional regulator [Streptomyces viridochromogenes]KOG08378.1 IclR family transcriptional regulator [Streptomyces viridochromogenes]KOG28696.1 IclR family transcriptional regulator [Streptomyces viridochromogenes]
MTTPHSGTPERSVVDRTLSILSAFDRANRTLSLSDISRRSGLPVATVHRIVNKLHAWGALERSADGGYSIGLRLWETGCLARRPASIAEVAHPHLVELHTQSSASATLAIRDGLESVGLSFVGGAGEHNVPFAEPGCRLPLHTTALGLVLLADCDESVLDEVCAAPLRAFTPATITSGVALRRHLTKVRREGYAVVHGTLTEGRGGIAVPVRDARGAVVAAVGAGGRVDLIRPVKLLHQVRAVADHVSRSVRACGWPLTQVGA